MYCGKNETIFFSFLFFLRCSGKIKIDSGETVYDCSGIVQGGSSGTDCGRPDVIRSEKISVSLDGATIKTR